MFSPETPPPGKYKPIKDSTPPKKENGASWMAKIFLALFIIGGIGAIAALIAYNPSKKELVCETGGRASLTGFGKCHEK